MSKLGRPNRLVMLALSALMLLVFASPAQAKRYLLTLVNAQIQPKKSTNKRWDTGWGQMVKPDPYVIVDIGGQRLTTPVVKNNHNPSWNISRTYDLSGQETVYIEIKDKDRFSDDLIGKTSFPFNKLLTKSGQIQLRFGGVAALNLKVISIGGTKTRSVPRTAPVVRPTATPPVFRKGETRNATAPPNVPRTPTAQPAPTQKPAARRPEARQPEVRQPEARKPEVRQPAPTKAVEAPQPATRRPKVRQPAAPQPEARRPMAPPVRQPESQRPATAKVNGAAFTATQFCLTMMRHSLTCIKQNQARLEKKGNAQLSRFMAMIAMRLEKAYNAKDPRTIGRCSSRLIREQLKVTQACLQCIQKQGCVKRDQAIMACGTTCKDAQPTPPITTPSQPAQPPAKRAEKVAPRPTTPAAPVKTAEAAAKTAEIATKTAKDAAQAATESSKQGAATATKTAEAAAKTAETATKTAKDVTNTAKSAAHIAKSTANTGKATVKSFCEAMTLQSMDCLKARLDMIKKDPKRAGMIPFFQSLVNRFKREKGKYVGKCVAGFAKHQAKRIKDGKKAVNSQQLAVCLQCMKKAGCDRGKQRSCRSICEGQ